MFMFSLVLFMRNNFTICWMRNYFRIYLVYESISYGIQMIS
jgi:hypothetical protein